MVPSSSYEILQVRGFTGHPFGPVDTIAVMCCPVLHNAINTLPFEDNLVLEVISFAQSFPRFPRSILRRKTCPLDQHHPLRGCDRCVIFPIQNGQGSDDGMMINSKGRKGSVNGRQRPVVRFQKRNVENVLDARIIGQGQSVSHRANTFEYLIGSIKALRELQICREQGRLAVWVKTEIDPVSDSEVGIAPVLICS